MRPTPAPRHPYCHACALQARFQCAPAYDKTMDKSIVTIRSFEFMRWLTIPGASDALSAGDRANTLTKTLTEPELRKILGKLGWVVPEKEQRVGKHKSARRERCAPRAGERARGRACAWASVRVGAACRWCGYILVNSEGAEMAYGTETKEFMLTLPCSFYGTNLDFIRGVPPPPCPDHLGKNARYDIVDHNWLPRKNCGIITEARAVAHFGLL